MILPIWTQFDYQSNSSTYKLNMCFMRVDISETLQNFVTELIDFCLKDSAGVLHLKRLSSAGLTHVHLLPMFQFAGVDDEKDKWKCEGKNIPFFWIIAGMFSSFTFILRTSI